MHTVSFDLDTCIGCGECALDCVRMAIRMNDDGRPEIPEDKRAQCFGCQHCLAICPVGAVAVDGVGPEEVTPLTGGLPELAELETLVGARRSVRRYKQEDVDPELLERLFRATANAPTGVNEMATEFTVVNGVEAMDRLREATYTELRRVVEQGLVPERLEWVANFIPLWEEKGIDGIYRGAPHFMVATTPQGTPTFEADPIIALTTFEMLAASAGLGTVWAGLAFWMLTKVTPDLRGVLGIPEDHVIGYAMAFGKPDVSYHRTVSRQGLSIREATLD